MRYKNKNKKKKSKELVNFFTQKLGNLFITILIFFSAIFLMIKAKTEEDSKDDKKKQTRTSKK